MVTSTAPPRVSVLTQHNDNARTGANLAESALTPDVVSSRFGFLFSLPVDGQIYAQPLYVADLVFAPLVRHDTLFVATEHDSVYAFDANKAAAPLWQTSLGNAATLNCFNEQILVPELGITGTPVIDPTTRTLYVVAFTADDPASCDAGNFHQMLYALDIVTGAPRLPPVEIVEPTPPAFVPRQALQRSALLLADGVLYIAFASHQGLEPYHGWLFAYDPRTLTQRASLITTPSALDGSIWMAGQGPSVDEAGFVYVSTGNGSFDGTANFADSVLKLTLDRDHFVIVDSFTPYNQAELQARDLDLGSAGPIIIPGTHPIAGQQRRLALVGGKQGYLYLLDRDQLGGYHPDGDHVPERLSVTASFVYGAGVYFDDGAAARLYVWPSAADLDLFELTDSTSGNYLKLASSSTVPRTTGLPGGFLSVSANGVDGGIVWANHPWSAVDGGDANAIVKIVPGVLRAFDARDATVELWNNRSDPNAPDEAVGHFAKFCPPTIANGKVYFAAWHPDDPDATGAVIVFGALP
ncbi:MAG: hypothetical protein ACXVDD_02050 [Polyangia bacterium]